MSGLKLTCLSLFERLATNIFESVKGKPRVRLEHAAIAEHVVNVLWQIQGWIVIITYMFSVLHPNLYGQLAVITNFQEVQLISKTHD